MPTVSSSPSCGYAAMLNRMLRLFVLPRGRCILVFLDDLPVITQFCSKSGLPDMGEHPRCPTLYTVTSSSDFVANAILWQTFTAGAVGGFRSRFVSVLTVGEPALTVSGVVPCVRSKAART